MRTVVFVVLSWAFAGAAMAQDFVPGRPGNTDSPIAVPAGRVQLETEIASFARDKSDGVTTKTMSLAETTVRYGLGYGADVEVIVSPYTRQTARGGGVDDRAEGFGDLTVRARKNLVGQNGDGPALALIGYLTAPTAQDDLGTDRVEGGLILTGQSALSDKWSVTATGDIGATRVNGSYRASYAAGVQLAYAATSRVGLYEEIYAQRAAGETNAVSQTGVTYALNESTQLDAGIELGVSDAADDARAFVGWAHLF